MRKKLLVTVFIVSLNIIPGMSFPQIPLPDKYIPWSFGSIKPSVWLKTLMQNDMAGFVGNLDRLVPDLIHDPIYGTARLHKQSKVQDLGNLKSGDAEGDEQYKWWNSETQSNCGPKRRCSEDCWPGMNQRTTKKSGMQWSGESTM